MKPAKFDWTIVFRKLHKKGQETESSKRKKTKTAKVQRAIVGATLEAIKAKREMNPAARLAERKKAVEILKAKKKESAEKKEKLNAQKAQNNQPKVSKQASKGFAPKAHATSR